MSYHDVQLERRELPLLSSVALATIKDEQASVRYKSMNKANLDVEFLLDMSGSMGTRDCAKGKKTRWEYGQETGTALAKAVEPYDDDGITVVVFNNTHQAFESVRSQLVAATFKKYTPGGSTNTAGVLKARLDAYFARKEKARGKKGGLFSKAVPATNPPKPLLLFVMTDGVPDDKPAVARVIINAANKIEKGEEIAICFVQVGNDSGATIFLKSLDDDLTSQGAKFDIVDALPIDAVENLTIEQLIEKAFND